MTDRRTEKQFTSVGHRPLRILLAEDNLEMRNFVAAALRKDGYEVAEAASGMEVLVRLGPSLYSGKEFEFDLVLSDIRIPDVEGLEILAGLRHCDGAPPVVLMTAFGDRKTHQDAERLGAAELLDKPFDIDELRAVLRRVLPPQGG